VADLPRRTLDVIRRQKLLADGVPVLVAVSGGCDSMVLLHLLARWAGPRRWRLGVAHFNHQLRGRAADRDEALVRAAAAQLRLPLFAGRGDVQALARRDGVSVELAARRLRHAFLAGAAQEFGARQVALAHHADDQVETFLLRALRGSGGDGLAGMAFRSPSPANARLELIRPLLAEPRAALATWAAAQDIPFREDASNRRVDVPRNLLRQRIVPVLRTRIQPALATTVPRLMTLVGDEADFVAGAARRWLARRRRGAFARLHPAVQRRVIQLQLIDLGASPSFDLVERLRTTVGVETTVPGGNRYWRDEAGALHPGRERGAAFDPAGLDLRLDRLQGGVDFDGFVLRWAIRRREGDWPVPSRAETGCEWLDADRLGKRVTLRHWRPGDRFQPIGLGRSPKLQDLFTNARVPAGERHRRVLAVANDGSIVWVEGLRLGSQARVTPRTRRLLEWRWERRQPPPPSGTAPGERRYSTEPPPP
jgi:tRNA(Ile)-lysidine synthase